MSRQIRRAMEREQKKQRARARMMGAPMPSFQDVVSAVAAHIQMIGQLQAEMAEVRAVLRARKILEERTETGLVIAR